MLSWMMTAVAGLAWLPMMPFLPPWPVLSAGALASSLVAFFCRSSGRRSALGLFALFLLCSAWSSAYCQSRLDQWFPASLAGEEVVLAGRVIGPLEKRGGEARPYWRFDFQLLPGQCAQHYCPPGQPRFRLNLYQTPVLEPGGLWRLRLKLRPPSGTRSPGAFDYARWLMANGYSGTGYVREVLRPVSGSAGIAGHYNHGRSSMLDGAADDLSRYRHHAVMRALLFADRRAMDNEHWRVFAATGTSHLMAISGMHIGIVLAWGMLLGRCVSALGHGGRRGLQLIAATGFLAALLYAAMAGFSLPTQRALIMAGVLCLTLALARQQSSWSALCLALLLILLVDPLSVHSAGLYLSFGAVAILLNVAQDRRWQRHPWRLALVAQLSLIIALAPVLTAWGFGLSAVALPVNLLAIPLLALVIMPLLFAALLLSPFPEISHAVFGLADAVLELLMSGLAWSAELSPLWWPQGGELAVLLGLAAAGLMLLPPGLPGRVLCLPLLVLLLFFPSARPALGSALITVLDVGQGLSVLIETAEHRLLYDVGPDFDSGYNSADAVVLPYLRKRGVGALDRLVLSHGDRDHSGSADALLEVVPVNELLSGEVERHRRFAARDCHAETPWQWDGVSFAFLPTGATVSDNPNNRSCVLTLSMDGRQVVIPGDIESLVESRLLASGALQGEVSLLLAAHHGSRSSSSLAWVKTLNPEHVVFTASRFNRYAHPHHAVVQRYARQGSQCWQTGMTGSLQFILSGEGVSMIDPPAKRFFWQHSPVEMCAGEDSPSR